VLPFGVINAIITFIGHFAEVEYHLNLSDVHATGPQSLESLDEVVKYFIPIAVCMLLVKVSFASLFAVTCGRWDVCCTR